MIASEGLPVQTAARVLEVSESGFYAWRLRPPSARSIRHVWLTDMIRQVHTASRGTYGANRVHAELSMVRSNSAFLRFSSRISRADPVETPSVSPASISA